MEIYILNPLLINFIICDKLKINAFYILIGFFPKDLIRINFKISIQNYTKLKFSLLKIFIV